MKLYTVGGHQECFQITKAQWMDAEEETTNVFKCNECLIHRFDVCVCWNAIN